MTVNLYVWHELQVLISAMFDCNVLLLRYFLAKKLPILHDEFLSSVSNFPVLRKQGLHHCRFSMLLAATSGKYRL